MVEEELLEDAPVTWFLSYRGAPLLLLPIRLTELIMDFPHEIPANTQASFTPQPPPNHTCIPPPRLTLKSAVLRAAGGNEVEGNVRGSADVIAREGPVGALIAAPLHTLAGEVNPPNHKH